MLVNTTAPAAHVVTPHRFNASRTLNSFHFDTDKGGEGGGAGGGGEGDKDKDKNKPEMISKAEADRAFKSRDQAKAGLRLLAATVGIDPDDIRVVPNPDDKENPYKLECDGIEDLGKLVADARKAKKAKKGKKGGEGEEEDGADDDAGWAERERELTGSHKEQLTKVKTKAKTREDALFAFIDDRVVTAELRAACAAEGAIDDDGGKYEDLVELIRKRVKVDRAFDDESGQFTHKVTALKSDGSPLLDGNGGPATPRQLVKAFLDEKPKFRQANFRSGPGAGGYGNPAQNKVTQNKDGAATVTPAMRIFGLA